MGLKGLYKKSSIILVGVIVIHFLWKQTRFSRYDPVFEPYSGRLNCNKLELKVGEKSKVYVMHVNNKATYESSNFRVAYVTVDGVVWGVQKGKAVIFVKVGEKEHQCRVTVK